MHKNMDSYVVIVFINITLDTELLSPHNDDREIHNVARKSNFLGKDKTITIVLHVNLETTKSSELKSSKKSQLTLQ